MPVRVPRLLSQEPPPRGAGGGKKHGLPRLVDSGALVIDSLRLGCWRARHPNAIPVARPLTARWLRGWCKSECVKSGRS